jgi:hypothetical protein
LPLSQVRDTGGEILTRKNICVFCTECRAPYNIRGGGGESILYTILNISTMYIFKNLKKSVYKFQIKVFIKPFMHSRCMYKLYIVYFIL